MHAILSAIFALALGIVLYTYVGYPLLLYLVPLRPGDEPGVTRLWPKISILVSAYNEEKHIADRIRNLLGLAYPPERLEILIGSDGSTDRTVELARQVADPRVKVLVTSLRSGKPAMLKRLAAEATGEVLVLTDANTHFADDALGELVQGLSDPHVGGVCGRLILESERANCEGVYWNLETGLKLRESRLDSCIGANGAIYAVRREAWPDFPDRTLVDDLVIPLRMREAGWRTIFRPKALAFEEAPRSIRDEMARRIRLGAGGFQALGLCWRSLVMWRGAYVWSFWSHKVLRWMSPFCMLAALLANLALVGAQPFDGLLALQVEFYAIAAAGVILERSGRRLLLAPRYFVAMNLALMVGFFRFVTRTQRVTWKRAVR